MFRALCLLSALALSGPVIAHPHVFVDTGLRLVTDPQGRLLGVEVSWNYDELYSMLMFEDRGLDNDYDGRLDDAEVGQLQGFDLNWIEGFEGDLYVTGPAGPITLGKPQGRGVRVEEARIISTHFRPLVQPQHAADLIVQAYDPTFYTAYDLTRGVETEGPCDVEVTQPDLDAAYSKVEELLYGMPASRAEEEFPEVGEAFAATVSFRCAN
ncbi:DUF1007 family protein [Thalassococcus sp. S3]|uniref:DUF1007 family protein n=1 Tax=Thalassococcus sp. S3 TaxID=2017482 RepID=UPI001024216F|nr:DUF1007 family protein [Thalassococcus sp. S3]QBF32815.1 polyphosphate kinase [Thalassococcus sp. S3]